MRNTKYSLEPYQEEFIADIDQELQVHNYIIAQLATGGGKTVVFAGITEQFLNETDKNVIIFVHRKELLTQTREKLFDWYNLNHLCIDTNTTRDNVRFFTGRVFVAMVETFDRRAKDSSFLNGIKNIGLVIIDEAHLENFKKIFDHFPDAKRIGFTATPISANKKDPLNNYYYSIIVGPAINELIEINKEKPTRGVVEDETYVPDNIDRNTLEEKGDDFDPVQMSLEFSKMRQIQNTIDAYKKNAFDKKMLCFNVSVHHSLLVTKEMCKAGLNAKHLDAKSSDEDREECFKWLKKTPNAILCNVGIATTGFDEPSVEGVIINKATKSLTLYKQMCGRSARPYHYGNGVYKTKHIILDMGDNAQGGGHGAWSDETDWADLFYNPQSSKTGKAPQKLCPKCDCLNPAAIRVCKGCGHEFEIIASIEDTVPKEMIRVIKGINVKQNINQHKDKSKYYSYFETIKKVAQLTRKEYTENILNEEQYGKFESACIDKVTEWFKLKHRKPNQTYINYTKLRFYKELVALGFIIEREEIDNLNIFFSSKKSLKELKNEAKDADEKYIEFIYGENKLQFNDILDILKNNTNVDFVNKIGLHCLPDLTKFIDTIKEKDYSNTSVINNEKLSLYSEIELQQLSSKLSEVFEEWGKEAQRLAKEKVQAAEYINMWKVMQKIQHPEDSYNSEIKESDYNVEVE